MKQSYWSFRPVIYENHFLLKEELKIEGRLLALDVGTKIIGIAISDALKKIANPKSVIIRKGNKRDFLEIQKMITKNSIQAIIIGLPINMNGSESAMSDFIRRFAANLDEFLGNFKIIFFDERLSSFAARDLIGKKVNPQKINQKNLVDQVAASLILQSFLDQLHQGNL